MEFLYTACGYKHFRKQFGSSSSSVKCTFVIKQSNLTARDTPHRNKKLYSPKNLSPWTFIVVLFITASNEKQPKCPLTGEWISKQWYIYTTKYYTVAKSNKLLVYTTIWMNLKYVMVSERHKIENAIIHTTIGKDEIRKENQVFAKGWE